MFIRLVFHDKEKEPPNLTENGNDADVVEQMPIRVLQTLPNGLVVGKHIV